jgi:hypothetical protein
VAAQENLDKMRAEAAERAQAQQATEERRQARDEADKVEARRQEDAFVARIGGDLTREALLEHIRRMRADKPEPPAPPPLTDAARKRLEEEQEAGRRALARYQAREPQPAPQATFLKADSATSRLRKCTAEVYGPSKRSARRMKFTPHPAM